MRSGIPDWQLTDNGTLKAFYERDITDEQNRLNVAVAPEAFMAILEGYACGNCLEYRAFLGTYLPRCPTCNEPTGAGSGHIIGEWWLDQPTVKP